MAGDASVLVPTLTTGTKIDVTEITRADATTVERQRVDVPDLAALATNQQLILTELRLLSLLMATAFNLDWDLDRIRADLAAST